MSLTSNAEKYRHGLEQSYGNVRSTMHLAEFFLRALALGNHNNVHHIMLLF